MLKRLITLAPLLVVFFAVQFTRIALASNDTTKLDAWQADFREVWSSDPCNVRRQSWDDYWGWVQKFYFGNGHWKGWFAYGADIRVRSIGFLGRPDERRSLAI
jgi:hypothetical protein